MIAERAVLGAMLTDPDVVEQVQRRLGPHDYEIQRHGLIHRAIVETFTEEGVTDPIAVGDVLQRRNRLDDAGGTDQLLDLLEESNTCAATTQVDHHVGIVLEHADRRRIRAAGQRLASAGNASADELRAMLEDTITPRAGTVRARVRGYNEFMQQPDFEFRMAGWLPTKGVAALGGAEHTGKSILAVDWAHRCLLGDAVGDWCEHPVRDPCSSIYIIGEDAQGIMLRSQAFVRERVGGQLAQQFDGTCEGRTIEFVDRMPAPLVEPVGIDEVRQIIKDFASQHGHKPGIVWLDTSSTLYGGDENDNAGMGQFAKHLGEVADEFDLLIVLIHHLRKPNGQPVRPSGADLRGAGCMSADFDVVMLVWRPKPEDRLSPIEVFIHKGKNGGTTGTAHHLDSEWVSMRQNRHGDDVGAPIMVPAPAPQIMTVEDKHKAHIDNVERIAFRMIAALRAGDHPGWVRNQTAAENLTHGKGKDKRAAWQLLEQRGWVANRGSDRRSRWELTEDAPPSHDERFGGADAA